MNVIQACLCLQGSIIIPVGISIQRVIVVEKVKCVQQTAKHLKVTLFSREDDPAGGHLTQS